MNLFSLIASPSSSSVDARSFGYVVTLSVYMKLNFVISSLIVGTEHNIRLQINDSQPGFRGTLGYRKHFLGVPRDVEITNVL